MQTMDKLQSRSAYWDNIKGFLIFLVVLAHCMYDHQNKPVIEAIVKGIYLFHMPAFIFVSGFFGKSKRAYSEKSIFTLLFAYFIFNSITGIILGWTEFFEPEYSYWYILALVIWRLASKYIPANRTSLIIAVICGVGIGYVPVITNDFALSRAIAFFPFYLAGLITPKERFETKPKMLVPGLIALIAAVGLGYLTIRVLNIQNEIMLMDAYFESSEVLSRISMFAVAAAAIVAILAFAPQRKIPLLTMFGRNSLPIFLIHRLITLVFSAAIAGYHTTIMVIASVLMSFAICLAFGNDTVGRLMNGYLEDGTELILRRKSPQKSSRRYNFAAASAFIVAAAIVTNGVISM